MTEPCENCGTPVKGAALEPTGRRVLLHLVEPASHWNRWMESWTEHTPAGCRSARTRRQETR